MLSFLKSTAQDSMVLGVAEDLRNQWLYGAGGWLWIFIDRISYGAGAGAGGPGPINAWRHGP